MSDQPQHAPTDAADHATAHDLPHEGPIKTPKQLIVAVAASFLVPIIGIVLLVNYVNYGAKPAAGSEGLGAEAVAERLQRVGRVELRDESNPATLRTGAQVFQAQCAACHVSGAAGAPKVGDTAAWAPRLSTGYESLLNSVLKGKGAMAAQSGGDASDFELARATVYLANESGGRLEEPAAPEAAASAAN